MLMVCLPAWGQSNYECLRYAVYKEARGESVKVQRAVMDVIVNRVKDTGKGVCAVLKVRGQFPWRREGIKRVDKAYLSVYNVVLKHPVVLGEGYLFFNSTRLPWGTGHRRIGNLIFSK